MCTFARFYFFQSCGVSAFEHKVFQRVRGPIQNSTNAYVKPNESSQGGKIIMETYGHHIRFIADPIPEEMHAFHAFKNN